MEGLALEKRYPGIRALGYIARLGHGDIPAFEARLRREGFDLPVRPVVGSADVFPVLFVVILLPVVVRLHVGNY